MARDIGYIVWLEGNLKEERRERKEMGERCTREMMTEWLNSIACVRYPYRKVIFLGAL